MCDNVSLPANSFTAFRLKYAKAHQIDRLSSCVRIGPVPRAWTLDKKSVLLSRFYRLKRTDSAPVDSEAMLASVSMEQSVLGPERRVSESSRRSEAGSEKSKRPLRDKLRSFSVRRSRRANRVAPAEYEGRSPENIQRKVSHGNGATDAQSFEIAQQVEAPTILPAFHERTSILARQRDESNLKILHMLHEHHEREDEQDDDNEGLSDGLHTPTIPPPSAATLTTKPESDITIQSKDVQRNDPLSEREKQRGEKQDDELNVPLLNEKIELAAKQRLKKSSPLDPAISAAFNFSNEVTSNEPIDQQNDSQSTSDSVDSFVTASESLDEVEELQDKAPLPLPNNSHKEKYRKTVEFTAINMKRTPGTKGSYLYTFESKKLLLRKINQEPCKNFDKEFELSSKNEAEKLKHQAQDEYCEEEDHEYDRIIKMKRTNSKYGKLFHDYTPGEIVKIDKVLVMVTTTYKNHMGVMETDEGNDTGTMDKWREYLIVARFTGNIDFPVILQFYKMNRVLEKDESEIEVDNLLGEIEDRLEQDDFVHSTYHDLKKINDKQLRRKKHKKHRGRACHFKIVLSKEDTKVRFFNLLDRALKVSKEHRKIIVNYILLFHSSLTSITWMNLLKSFTGDTRRLERETIFIKVPLLDVSFNICNMNKLYHKALVTSFENSNSEYISLKVTPNGYHFKKMGVMDEILTMIQRSINNYLMSNGKFRSQDHQRKVDEFLNLLTNDRRFLSLAFRKFDRLEWLVGKEESLKYTLWSILGTYFDLELREFVHDDVSLLYDPSHPMEPLPFEGFIVRLTNRRGKNRSRMGRNYFKLMYGYTCSELLFLQHFYHAIPAFGKGAKEFITPNGQIIDMDKAETHAQYIKDGAYTYRPFQSTDGRHIDWLDDNIRNVEDHDLDAIHEAERRSVLIANSSCIIDLTQVEKVSPVNSKDVDKLVKAAGKTVWHQDRDINMEYFHHGIHKHKIDQSNVDPFDFEDNDNVFEMFLCNGKRIQFQVASRTSRNEWVERLTELSRYWKLKKAENIKKKMKLREMNSPFNNDSMSFSNNISDHDFKKNAKWEFTHAYTDESIYSISPHSIDKPMLFNREVYRRVSESKPFEKKYMVLSSGFLTIYDMINRTKVNKYGQGSVFYKKESTVALCNCYIFAGSLCLAGEGNDFNINSSMLYQDGLRTNDSKSDCIFSIWFGSKRMLIKSTKKTKQSNNLTRARQMNLSDLIKKEIEFADSDEDDENETEVESDVEDTTDSETEPETEFESDDDDETEKKHKVAKKKKNKDITTLKEMYPDDPHASMWDIMKMISKLGARGKILTFLARSRLERDLWVTRIKAEIDRYSIHRKEDFDIV